MLHVVQIDPERIEGMFREAVAFLVAGGSVYSSIFGIRILYALPLAFFS